MQLADPAARLSSEQQAVADRGGKAMMPVAQGRPLLDFILSRLADAGVTNVALVVGAEHDAIRKRYRAEVALTRLHIDFVTQAHPRGTADAVVAAEGFAGSDDVLVVNGDNLYPLKALVDLVNMAGPGLVGYHRAGLIASSNIDPDRIAKFAVIWTDRGVLTRIVEKPDPRVADTAALVSMNSWRLSPAIFDACRAIGPSARGEWELQDAVSWLLARGATFRVVESHEGVLDLSNRADVAEVGRRLAREAVRL